VRDRASGKKKSKLEGQVDLLELFSKNKDVFTEEYLIDELIDFFLAAQVTSMNISQVICAHFCKNKDTL
jgi:hypothetical protein